MNLQQHAFIAILIGICIAYIQTLIGIIPTMRDAWLFIFICMFFGVLPDQIEPANHYTHRKFWHSQQLFSTMKYPALIFIIASFIPYVGYFASFVGYSFAGYYTHLLLDYTTPMSLYGSKKHKQFSSRK